jgi:hypothetical protein
MEMFELLPVHVMRGKLPLEIESAARGGDLCEGTLRKKISTSVLSFPFSAMIVVGLLNNSLI